MEEYDDPDIQEHGPELWFSNWERQCLTDAEQTEPSDAEAHHDQRDKLWHLFQTTATAVAQLYKDPGCHHHHHHHYQQQQQQQQQQHGASLWVPFQSAAAAVTNLYKESTEARQRSYEMGVQVGHQRRNRDILSWAKKRRRTIRREDLIGFLCGKAPPPRSGRANSSKPRLADPASSDVVSSVGTSELQPLREAVTVQALNGAMASITVCSGAPGSPTHGSRGGSRNVGVAAGGHSGELCRSGRRSNNGLHEVDLSTFISKEMALHMEPSTGSARKRNHTQCGSDVFTHTPTHKRSRI